MLWHATPLGQSNVDNEIDAFNQELGKKNAGQRGGLGKGVSKEALVLEEDARRKRNYEELRLRELSERIRSTFPKGKQMDNVVDFFTKNRVESDVILEEGEEFDGEGWEGKDDADLDENEEDL